MMNLFALPNGTVVNLFKAISVSGPQHSALHNKFFVVIHFDGPSEGWEFTLSRHNPNEGAEAARERAVEIHKQLIECWAE